MRAEIPVIVNVIVCYVVLNIFVVLVVVNTVVFVIIVVILGVVVIIFIVVGRCRIASLKDGLSVRLSVSMNVTLFKNQ